MRRKAKELVWEETPVRLPAELSEFLSRETYSLLIKGGSGSGKTILALTILAGLKSKGNMLYLSTRTSPLQLLKDYPWIGKVFGRGPEPSPEGRSEAAWETLVDARLDEPGVVFERITNVLMDKQAPTVVVDSWESLNDSMDNEALRTNIRVLQTWRERARARFIFVGEEMANTTIDSIVDGVVTLGEQVSSGRRLREIFLSKLRGVQISRPTYFFSLESGVFHSFDRFAQSEFGIAKPASSQNPRSPGGDQRHISTGFRSLDEVMGGGYAPKSVALIEADPRVDPRVVVAFLSGTIREWAAGGRRVVLHKSEMIDAASVSQLKGALGGSASSEVETWDPHMGAITGRVDSLAGLQTKVAEAKTPVLVVVDWDKITESTGAAGAASDSLIDFLKRKADLSILASRSKPAQSPLSGIASTHIKIVEINGTVFAMSEKPWSELYAMVPGKRSSPGLQLERVV
jgi:KaiC/GvpD/RAD55 family RecA-like ATPase